MVVSSHYRIGCMSNLLELVLCGGRGDIFAISLLFSIDRSFPTIIIVLLKEVYVCSIIGVSFVICWNLVYVLPHYAFN